MIKVSFFRGESEQGPKVIPLFGPADPVFEKVAAPTLLPDVVRYIETLRPRNDAQYSLVNAMGAGEFWGCFPEGTLVQTFGGEVPIEEIQEGDEVLTHKNRFRPVLATQVRPHVGELVDLAVVGLPSDVPALTATPNHELWVVLREDFHRARRDEVYKADTSVSLENRRSKMLSALDFSWVPIGQLSKGDLIAEAFPLHEATTALGDEKWNRPEIAFLLGLYAAEGCLSHKYPSSDKPRMDKLRNGSFERPLASVIFVVGAHELETIKRAEECATALGYSLQVTPEESNSVRLELSYQAFAELCLDHIGRHSTKKKLSQSVLVMPRGWQETFFQAYAGGDGCVRGAGKGEGSVRCVSASPKLLMGMRLLLARLGLCASISGRHNKKATWYNGNPIYELLVGGSQFGDAPQAKSFLHPDGFILSYVKATRSYEWTGNVYNLHVAEDNSYTASGIAVHNSNVNGDHFPEAALIHAPDDWSGNPLVDKIHAKSWPYGYPTFYYAFPYAHHRNKDASRAFGEVELAAWNSQMKRVELVTRVDKNKCELYGGTGVWDKLKAGDFPDVSMGAKVPFDTCSICLDWKLYRQAQGTFDPAKHKHPGEAVLAVHKARKAKDGKGIRGLSITRSDYCTHAQHQMNKILPDGRKVFVYNDYPRFFDISFVFIGADKTAKVMMKIASGEKKFWFLSGAELADELGYQETEEKTAEALDGDLLKLAFVGKVKENEITKDVVPSQFAGKAVPVLTRSEPDLPKPILDRLGSNALSGMATAGALGIILRPKEFQRVILVQLGKRSLADEFEDRGVVFPAVDEEEPMPLETKDFSTSLMRLLLPFLNARSALGPIIERRVMVTSGPPHEIKKRASSLSSELLRKMGAAYSGYRRSVMDLVTSTQDLVASAATPNDRDLLKIAHAPLQSLFTPLSAAYLTDAFKDEVGLSASGDHMSHRGEGFPLEEHAAIRNAFGGHTS